jgi:Tol biopolymer transport system component
MRRHWKGFGSVIAVAALWAGSAAAQERRPMGFVDTLSLPVIQDPQLSPDGRQVLFVMDGPDWKANRRVGHVHRINSDGTGQVQLTFGERGESSPRWSPDGTRVAFLARREADEHNQIYLLNVAGGEARRLTQHPAPPTNLTWAPDGSRLFFTATDAKSPEEREREKLQDDVYRFEETNFKQRHLWTADLEGQTRKLTDGDFSIEQYALSPDGSRVALSRSPSPLLEFSHLSEVWVMDASGANLRQLTSGNRIAERGLAISPDNTRLLFTAGANEAMEGYHNGKVFVMPLSGGRPRQVTPATAAYDVSSAEWSKDGSRIYFVANLGVHDEIFVLDPESRVATNLTSGQHSLNGWRYVKSADRFVFTRNTPEHPAEVHVAAPVGGTLMRVTSVIADLSTRFLLARQERFTW